MKKILFIFITFSLFAFSCDYAKQKATNQVIKSIQPKERAKPNLKESEKYHAIVTNEMTLVQVADTNDIAISFLKQSLGIPHYINQPYTILQLSRNYQFTVDELKRIIDANRDKKTERDKSTSAGSQGNNQVKPNN